MIYKNLFLVLSLFLSLETICMETNHNVVAYSPCKEIEALQYKHCLNKQCSLTQIHPEIIAIENKNLITQCLIHCAYTGQIPTFQHLLYNNLPERRQSLAKMGYEYTDNSLDNWIAAYQGQIEGRFYYENLFRDPIATAIICKSRHQCQIDASQCTAFFAACYAERMDILTALSSNPAVNVNQLDEYKRTALTMLCSNEQAEMIQNLLTIPGIDSNGADGNGNTPLGLAQERQYLKIIQLLKRHQAKS